MLVEYMRLIPASQYINIYDIDTNSILYDGYASSFIESDCLYDNCTVHSIYTICNLDSIFIDVTRKGSGDET